MQIQSNHSAFVYHSPLAIEGKAVAESDASKRSGLTESSFKPINESAKTGTESRADSAEPISENDSEQELKRAREAAAREQAEKQVAQQEMEEIERLSARDREVRAHEQAHVAAGGQYAGAPSYQYERGPNGVSYAVSGEVPISSGKEATPEATIAKAQVVRRAALAPAEPSPQDRRVAAAATRMEAEARRDLNLQQMEERESTKESDDETEGTANGTSETSSSLASDKSFSAEHSTNHSQKFQQRIFAAIEPSASGLTFSAYA